MIESTFSHDKDGTNFLFHTGSGLRQSFGDTNTVPTPDKERLNITRSVSRLEQAKVVVSEIIRGWKTDDKTTCSRSLYPIYTRTGDPQSVRLGL